MTVCVLSFERSLCAFSHDGVDGVGEQPMYHTDSVAEEESTTGDVSMAKTNGKPISKPRRTAEEINAEIRELLQSLEKAKASYEDLGKRITSIDAKVCFPSHGTC